MAGLTKLWFALLLVFLVQIEGQTQVGELVSEELAYDLINQVFQEKEEDPDRNKFRLSIHLLNYDDVLTHYGNFIKPEFYQVNRISDLQVKIEDILTASDFEFMARQVSANITDQLDPKLLRIKKKRISMKENGFRKKRFSPGLYFYQVAWPVFSEDKKWAFLYTTSNCGMLCGSGSLFIYQRDSEGKWKSVGNILVWIS